MKITNELIKSVCLNLGIEYTDIRDKEGGVYIKDGNGYRKFNDEDFERIFGFQEYEDETE